MSADTNVNVAKRLTAVALVLVGAGCASGAWTRTNDAFDLRARPFVLPAHRAVERVTLHVRGREFEFVGYRTCDPSAREVRAQLLLESGPSVLDVAVHGDRGERISGSAFEAIPRFAETAMDDLRRTWGSHSVFAVNAPVTGFRVSPWNAASMKAADATMPAVPLGDGSFLAIADRARAEERQVVTLLDRDLAPLAQIAYSDFDDDGVPREIHLVDLRDHHTLDVEVEEVRVVVKSEEPAK